MNKSILTLCLSALLSTTLFAQKEQLNVMTFNIRYDNPSDAPHNWGNRKEFAANAIKFYDADIVGTQEVLHHQLQDLQAALPQYATIGVAREDGKTKGEYSAILYKKDQFKILDSGTFWLAEDVNSVGKKGWDAACERVVTWALMQDKATKEKFLFMNTHFDHEGQVARRNSANLLLDKAKELSKGNPIVVTGDFNATVDEEPIQIITDMTNSKHLTDARSKAHIVYGPNWTFHDFGRLDQAKRNIIDYIFVSDNVKVKAHGIISETLNGLYLSDHNPIISTIEF